MTTNLRRARCLSIGLLLVLVAGTVTATLSLRNLVHDQNDKLLAERTSEAGLLLTSTFQSIKPSLSVLGAAYAVDPDGIREVREYWERFWSQALAAFKAVADTEAEQRAGIGRKESSDGDRGRRGG